MKSSTNIIIGFHAVQSLLKTRPERANELLIVGSRHDQRVQKTIAMAGKNNINIRRLSSDEMDKVSSSTNHQGCILIAVKGKAYDEKWLFGYLETLERAPIVLVLDGLTDPHNMGACLRSAAAAGVDAVIAPRDKSVGLTPVVKKVASGATETTPFVLVTNLSRILAKLREKGFWVCGAAGEANQSYCDVDYKVPTALVMGSENRGLRRLTREACDYLVKIPMNGDAIESLNISVATGIILYEIVRQRQWPL